MITEINTSADYHKACKFLEKLGDNKNFEKDKEKVKEWDRVFELVKRYDKQKHSQYEQ